MHELPSKWWPGKYSHDGEVKCGWKVNSAFGNFLNEEVILDRECPVCLSKHNAYLKKRVVVAGKYLVVNSYQYES